MKKTQLTLKQEKGIAFELLECKNTFDRLAEENKTSKTMIARISKRIQELAENVLDEDKKECHTS